MGINPFPPDFSNQVFNERLLDAHWRDMKKPPMKMPMKQPLTASAASKIRKTAGAMMGKKGC